MKDIKLSTGVSFLQKGLGALSFFCRGKTPPPVIFGLEVSPHLHSVAQVSPIYPQALPLLLPPASPLEKLEGGGICKAKVHTHTHIGALTTALW